MYGIDMYNTSDLSLLPPTSDYVFCNLFGAEENIDCLKSLLNSILKGNPSVEKIILKPTEYKKRTKDGKSIRADIMADTNDKTMVDIEMQCSNLNNSLDRMIFYQALHRSRSIEECDDYEEMPQIISIWILIHSLYGDRNDCTHEIKLALYDSDGVYVREASDKERIIVVELDKLPSYIEKLKHTKTQDEIDRSSAWMSFITNPLNMPEECNHIEEIQKALEKLKGMSNNPNIRAEYNQAMREKSDLTMNYNKGFDKGKEQGREEGLEEGREEGARQMAIETAKNLLKMNILTIEQIAEASVLSVDDVSALKEGC